MARSDGSSLIIMTSVFFDFFVGGDKSGEISMSEVLITCTSLTVG